MTDNLANDAIRATDFAETLAERDRLHWRRTYKAAALAGWVAQLTEMDEYDNEPRAFAEHQRAVAETCAGYADAMLAEDDEHAKAGGGK